MNIKGQNGRTMLEMLGVFLVIGLITASGLIGYQEAYKRNVASRVYQNVNDIYDDINRLWSFLPQGDDIIPDLCDVDEDLVPAYCLDRQDFYSAIINDGIITITATASDAEYFEDILENEDWEKMPLVSKPTLNGGIFTITLK